MKRLLQAKVGDVTNNLPPKKKIKDLRSKNRQKLLKSNNNFIKNMKCL